MTTTAAALDAQPRADAVTDRGPGDWAQRSYDIWRRSLREQHAAICDSRAGCSHYGKPKKG